MFINIYQPDKVKKFVEDKILFGNELTPELAAILTVYFVQGILGLARLAVSFFLKDELMLSPAQVSALMGVAAIPWVTKPVIGFFSDSKPLFSYHRRSYLILSGFLGANRLVEFGYHCKQCLGRYHCHFNDLPIRCYE